MQKLPPIEKVYEAWSALADGRVDLVARNHAVISSSDGAKSYDVVFDAERHIYYSDDNATFWRGYPGYPVIAVMMLTGVLPYDSQFAQLWADVNWHELNQKYRRDYAAAVAEVESQRNIDNNIASAKAQQVMDALASLPASVKRLTPKILDAVKEP